jgi:hypothetical protein
MSQNVGHSFVKRGPNKNKITNSFKISLRLSSLSHRHVFVYYNSENSRKVDKGQNGSVIAMQKENKISDRIQDKLNIIRNGYEMRATSSTDINKRRDHTPITGKKIKNEVGKLTSNSKKDQNKVERISFI